MNAYELADELENYVWMNPNNNRDYCKEVKDMIRQQADRIAELSKNVDELEEELLKAPQIKELNDEEIQSIWHEGIGSWYGTQDGSVMKFAG